MSAEKPWKGPRRAGQPAAELLEDCTLLQLSRMDVPLRIDVEHAGQKVPLVLCLAKDLARFADRDAATFMEMQQLLKIGAYDRVLNDGGTFDFAKALGMIRFARANGLILIEAEVVEEPWPTSPSPASETAEDAVSSS